MLHLPNNLLVNRGNRRLVFIHPNDPSRCLKTAAPGNSPREIRLRKVWHKRLRPDHSYDDNHLEMAEFTRLCRHVPDPTFALPRLYGMVATDRGPALEQDLIRSPDGTVAPNLYEFLRSSHDNPGLRSNLHEAMTRFTEWFWTNRIVVHDLHPRNVLVCCDTANPHLILIDGLGAYSLVPLEDFLPYPVSVWRLPGKIRRFFRLANEVLTKS